MTDSKPKGIPFDPLQLTWTGANGEPIDGAKLFRRYPRPEDTASADLLKRLGITPTDTPPAAGDPSHREI